MKLFRKVVWSPFALTCLKWSALLFGMIVGAYVSGFVKRHVVLLLIIALLLIIKPLMTYFGDKDTFKGS